MNASPNLFFNLQEIMERIAERRSTGLLHVFCRRDSANIFYEEGRFVAGQIGNVEGEAVLVTVQSWNEPRYVWLSDATPDKWGISPFNPAANTATKKSDSNRSSASPGKIPDLKPLRAVRTGGGPPQPLLAQIISESPPLPASLAASPEPSALRGVTLDTSPRPDGSPRAQEASSLTLTSTRTLTKVDPARTMQDESILSKFKLVLVSSDDPTRRYPILRISSLIGRNPACDISINDGSISRQHCFLQLTERGLHIKDLGTTNGTRINGIRLTDGYVTVGDKLVIGNLNFVLENAA